MDLKAAIAAKAAQLTPKIQDHRRYLHAHPELSLHEYRTAAWVAARLKEMGLEPAMHVGGRGVTAVIAGAKGAQSGPGRTVALRADMDALPIEESTDLPYKSKQAGVMHACGHDGHTANLLGAAEILLDLKDSFTGRVKLLFQPAEEQHGGAAMMIEDGVLEGPHVDAIFALHGWPDVPVGTLAHRSGPTMAAGDRFEITVTGKGSHAAFPHTGLNLIAAMARLVTDLHSIPATRVPASESAVVSVSHIAAGQGIYNVIPHSGRMLGTFRTLTPEVRRLVGEEIRMRCTSLEALGFQVDCQILPGYPVTRNAAELEPLVAQVLAEQLGATGVAVHPEASMGAEDFAFYGAKVPAYYLRLGLGERPNLHSPTFDFNDAALPTGMAALARLAVEYLER